MKQTVWITRDNYQDIGGGWNQVYSFWSEDRELVLSEDGYWDPKCSEPDLAHSITIFMHESRIHKHLKFHLEPGTKAKAKLTIILEEIE